MGRAFELLLFFIIVLTAVYFWRRAVTKPKTPKRWTLEEAPSKTEEFYDVWLQKGNQKVSVGSLRTRSQDFEYQLEELRSEARVKAAALNNKYLS